MNFQNLKTMSRKLVAGATSNKINDSILTTVLNEGALDIASKLNLIKKNKKFDVVADQQEYIISDTASDFLRMDESGLYWNRATLAVPDWGDPLDSYSREKLDVEFRYWRSDVSGQPERYYQESDLLVVHPTPSVALTSGFWMYYIAKPVAMSANTDYPFGGTTEIPQYSILSETLLLYAQWRLTEMLGKMKESTQAYTLYISNLKANDAILKERRDIDRYDNCILRGRIIR